MGLFSSEYVTTVGTTVSRAIPDAAIVPSSKTGLIAGLFGKSGDQLVENILENMVAGLGIRVERLYDQAKAGYPYGLPTSKVSSIADGKEVVLAALTQEVGTNTVDYYHLGPLNTLHYGWHKLCSTYGYTSDTNELASLSASKGYPVYLKDMVAVFAGTSVATRAPGSLEQWGIAANAGYTPERLQASAAMAKLRVPSTFRIETGNSVDSLEVTYTWVVPTLVIITPATTKVVAGVVTPVPAVTVMRDIYHTESLSFEVTLAVSSQDFFHVRYIKGGKAGYWLYELGGGLYPEVDSIFDVATSTAGQFFPVVYFRHLAQRQDTDKQSVAYKKSTKLLKTLGMDYQDLVDAIHENPEINKVDQAFLTLAVPANTTNPLEQQYLFDFFNKMYLASGGIAVGEGWELGDVGSGTAPEGDRERALSPEELAAKNLLNKNVTNNIRITIEDSRLSTGLSCQSIFKRKKAGVIGAVGTYTSSFLTHTTSYPYKVRTPTEDVDGIAGFLDTSYTLTQPSDSYLYRKQITSHVYEEIQVYDLKMTYYMWGGYSTVGDNLDAILLVPLDHAITKDYGLSDREALYSRSLHYVFNSRTVTEVKWYQQAWFGDLITAIGLILTVLSLGADGGFFASAGAAIAAGVEALALFVVQALLDYVVVTMVMKLFVKALGPEFAFLVAIVAIAYGGYKAFEAGSVKGAPWAKELLQLGNGLASSVSAAMSDALLGLQKESEEFNLLAKEKTTLLEDTNKLLEQQTLLSPFVIFGESPDDFYNRTIHAGNIGILGIDSIASFVDIALTLPKLNDTLEGNSYG